MKCVGCNFEYGTYKRFCPECGAKQPELKCSCGFVFVGEQPKFCPECGKGQTEFGSKESIIGDKNLVSTSGGDIANTKITGGYVQVHYHEVDDSKKIIQCSVSGKRILKSESILCLACNKHVAEECFDRTNYRCVNCEQKAKTEFTNIILDFIFDGKRFDKEEDKKILEEHRKRLVISGDEAKTIILEERIKIHSQRSSYFLIKPNGKIFRIETDSEISEELDRRKKANWTEKDWERFHRSNEEDD